MRVTVTGGAGYIGSHTVRLLSRAGHDVVVYDNLGTGHAAAVGETPLVVGDIRDTALVAATMAEHGCEAVVHFAAHKAAGESMSEPGKYFDNNVGGTMSVLEACRRAGVDRFVFSSTAAVYGTPGRLPVAEDHPVAPENPYGESKATVERMLRWWDRVGLHHVSLRYFNAAGAATDGSLGEDNPRATNLVPVVMEVATGRRPVLDVYGDDYPTEDGTAVRDYVHVEDLADAHVRALEHLGNGGSSEVFNLGTENGYSVREVVATAREVTGVDIPVRVVGRRPGDPARVFADSTRAARLLGWKATRDLHDIVASAWRWHSSHPHGYGDGGPGEEER